MINKMHENLQVPSNQTEMKTEAKTSPNKCSKNRHHTIISLHVDQYATIALQHQSETN